MNYSVHRNRDGFRFDAAEFATLDEALAHAAKICGVTLRTMKGRYSKSPAGEVSGREMGRDGVWVEEI